MTSCLQQEERKISEKPRAKTKNERDSFQESKLNSIASIRERDRSSDVKSIEFGSMACKGVFQGKRSRRILGVQSILATHQHDRYRMFIVFVSCSLVLLLECC
jgi:hypothetical protein